MAVAEAFAFSVLDEYRRAASDSVDTPCKNPAVVSEFYFISNADIELAKCAFSLSDQVVAIISVPKVPLCDGLKAWLRCSCPRSKSASQSDARIHVLQLAALASSRSLQMRPVTSAGLPSSSNVWNKSVDERINSNCRGAS